MGVDQLGWNYQRVLPTKGWAACTIDLPNHGASDIQPAADYVVYAIRTMAHESGRKITVIGHSQGGLETPPSALARAARSTISPPGG